MYVCVCVCVCVCMYVCMYCCYQFCQKINPLEKCARGIIRATPNNSLLLNLGTVTCWYIFQSGWHLHNPTRYTYTYLHYRDAEGNHT